MGDSRGTLGSRFISLAIALAVAALPVAASAEEPAGARAPSGTGSVAHAIAAQGNEGLVVETTGGDRAAFQPDRVIVKFRGKGTRPLLAGTGVIHGFPGDPDLSVVEIPRGLSVAETVAQYRQRQDVVFAEPDFIVTALDVVPNDPLWSGQWDMVKIGAPGAWASQTDASDVVVAVLDTGIDLTHPDLLPNLWTNPADGSHGFVAKSGVVSAGGQDDNGHGTHVAGTIGAAANNGVGIAGINWKVRLLALKFLAANGSGSTSDAILLLDKVVSLRQQGVNVRVLNNSWGGGGYSRALEDAFARTEAAGVLNVCAAGNSGLNADMTPMYPAAFGLRGIVSVLASDSNDRAASFSNFGRFSTDLAAPGVSTLSTVPTGSCSLCASTGYRNLSGTSMASPQVAGVAAALFHVNPSLTPAQARDVLLDPGSTDLLSDPKGVQSTTSARLSFVKALANPLLGSPRLNGFPVVSAPASIFAGPGQSVTLQATGSDPDGDPVTSTWSKTRYETGGWIVGRMIDAIFPAAAAVDGSFTAPAASSPVTVSWIVASSDGRGGSAMARTDVTVGASPSPGRAAEGTLAVTPATAPAGSTVTIDYPVLDPEGGPVLWDAVVNSKNGSAASCCFSGPSAVVSFPNAGVYRVRVQAVDGELNVSPSQSAVVSIGGATGIPPLAVATLDKASGPAPLIVTWDLRGSHDPDGSLSRYLVDCGATGIATQVANPTGTCTFEAPGLHRIRLFVVDNSGQWDNAFLYAMVTTEGGTAAPSADTTAPSVSLSSPTSGAILKGTVSVAAIATDDVGVTRVDFYLDGSILIGSRTASPWSVAWDTSTVSAGSHALTARAFDAAGNSSTSTPVTVTVAAPVPADTTPPVSAITSPAAGATVVRRSTVTITASASDDTGVTRVDFTVDGSVVCSTTKAPYACSWTVGAKPRQVYELRANARDAAGNTGPSAAVQVTSN